MSRASIDRRERSPEVNRLIARLRAKRRLDPDRPHAQPDVVRARMAEIALTAQYGQWEHAALGVAADMLGRARRVADLEAAATLDRAQHLAEAERRRIVEEARAHAQRMLDNARRDADTIVQAARLRSIADWMPSAPRPAITQAHGGTAVAPTPLPRRQPPQHPPRRARRARPSEDLDPKLWPEAVRLAMAAIDNRQSIAEHTGRAFEDEYAYVDASDRSAPGVGGWLRNRWDLPPRGR